MEIRLDKSFEENLEASGTNETEVLDALFKLDAAKKGASRKGGSEEDGEEEKVLSLSERIAIAKAAVIAAVAKLARPAAAGALLITTHQAFRENICSAQTASIAKSLSFLPIVGQYSEQCDSAQKAYASAMMTAATLATSLILPQLRDMARSIQIPDEIITTIANAIGKKSEPAKVAPTAVKGKGRKKTLRKSRKMKTKKSARRY